MKGDPWQVKFTPNGRSKLQRLVEQYRAEGDEYRLARSLIQLAIVYKQIGNEGQGDLWQIINECAIEAVELFRKLGASTDLVDALAFSGSLLFTNVDKGALLAEAEMLGKEVGNLEGAGWSLFHQHLRPSELVAQRIRKLFARARSHQGLGSVDLRAGMQLRNRFLLYRAIWHFRRAQSWAALERAQRIAAVFLRDQLGEGERLSLIQSAYRACKKARAQERLKIHLGRVRLRERRLVRLTKPPEDTRFLASRRRKVRKRPPITRRRLPL